MIQLRAILFLAIVFAVSPSQAQEQKVIIVTGAAGEAEYGEMFETWADRWQTTIEKEGGDRVGLVRIGAKAATNDEPDLKRLELAIKATTDETKELWIVLIGHGTDDRKTSKFNLRGKDVTATQLSTWLAPLPCRTVVINCASASGAFIAKLQSKNRIVMTATKSGAQHNFARFGGYLSEAISDPSLDLDKDQQTSLLEAFVAASASTQEFYVTETRLASELAMIDDNGDGKGTPADWFRGVRVVRKSKNGIPDGLAANQIVLIRRGVEAQLSSEARKKRDQLEAKLELLRAKKSSMETDAYFLMIEPILLELAELYASQDSETSSVVDQKPESQK